MAPLWSYSLTG